MNVILTKFKMGLVKVFYCKRDFSLICSLPYIIPNKGAVFVLNACHLPLLATLTKVGHLN